MIFWIHQEDQQNMAVKHPTLQPLVTLSLTLQQLNLSYSAPIFKTSATALRGTGICYIYYSYIYRVLSYHHVGSIFLKSL